MQVVRSIGPGLLNHTSHSALAESRGYMGYWLKTLLYSIRHMLFRVPIPMVWRVVVSHRLNSVGLGMEDVLGQLWWSDKIAERRGLQQVTDIP